MDDESILEQMSDSEFRKVAEEINPELCDRQGLSCHGCIMIEKARRYGLKGGVFTCIAISKEAKKRGVKLVGWRG